MFHAETSGTATTANRMYSECGRYRGRAIDDEKRPKGGIVRDEFDVIGMKGASGMRAAFACLFVANIAAFVWLCALPAPQGEALVR